MQAVALPETTLFTPTPVSITETIHPTKAKVELNAEIKMGAEEAYSKAEDTEKKLNEVRAGMLDMYNDMKNDWIPNKNKDEFEERPTTEPNNLIFDARRDRMSMEPKWA
jgi:ArsR family metal-binding transcriptional regulator